MDKLISDDIARQVKDLFLSLEQDVEILFFGKKEDCEYCAEVLQLVEEVSDLDKKIGLQAYDLDEDSPVASRYNVTDSPTLVIAGREGEDIIDYGVRFLGAPAGHEFTTLVHDLLIVSKRRTDLTEDTRKFLRGLTEPLLLQVFVTPTCPYCPQAVLLAHQMAMESDSVQAEMIEAGEFRDLAEKFMVSGVPQTTINSGAETVVGALPEVAMLERLQSLVAN
jgi:glutaredoxin-like protein